jgi:hypothetical protein
MPDRWTPTTAQHQAAAAVAAAVAAALAATGFALPGTVQVRSYRCGKPNCACHRDPPRLHGPYIQWTRRTDGKTIHTNLTEEQLADYQPFFDTARRLRNLIDQLEALTLEAIRTDHRTNP